MIEMSVSVTSSREQDIVYESLLLSYPDGVTVSTVNNGEIVVGDRLHTLNLGQSQPLTCDILDQLTPPGAPLGQLVESVTCSQGPSAVATLFHHLQRLSGRGLLQSVLKNGDHRLATMVPAIPAAGLRSGVVPDDGLYRLSRFAFLRRVGNNLVMETPLSAVRVLLHDPVLAGIVLSLTSAASCRELVAGHGDFSYESLQQVLNLLHAAKLVELQSRAAESCGNLTSLSEDDNPELQAWEFHDLLFHTRSRMGRHAEPTGATYRLSALQDPLSATKVCDRQNAIALFYPDLTELAKSDPPLSAVMEQRCSIREFGREPMTIEQLGEFLFRVARVRQKYEMALQTPQGVVETEMTSRPYPSGGALYPLEFYLLIRKCRGIDAGVYHYDALEHQLIPVSDLSPSAEEVLLHANYSTGVGRGDVQVLIVMTARFRRVSWKYSSLAYSLILKEVGVMIQNMYLAAAAMKLAPCAIGSGNSDVFAKAISSDYYAETSVGEFLLGST